MSTRRPYPSDVSDDEWAFVAPYLTLLSEDAVQRTHDLRAVFNTVRWAAAAAVPGIHLEVVKLALTEEAQGPKRGFVLLPRRWVAERSFAWMARFRHLARDDERLPQTGTGLTFLALVCLMLHQCFQPPFSS